MNNLAYDRSLQSMAERHMDDECDRAEEALCNYAEVKDAIKTGIKLKMGFTGEIDPADGDLHDKVYPVQKQIMLAYVLGNDAEMLRIMKALCSAEIDTVVDLIYG